MAEEKLTPEQELAIIARGRAVLVSAGAGSGKTSTLTKRLMNYILDPQHPADIDTFLVITFTRAAAAELRTRIDKNISEALEKDPDNPSLRRQKALCRNAKISTIHSFCSELLREFSYSAGISPEFKIADDNRAQIMRAKALDDILEEFYSNPGAHPGFLALADSLGAGRDDSNLVTAINDLYSKMQSHPRPEKWAQECIGQMNQDYTDAGKTVWGEEILSYVRHRAQYCAREFERLYAEAEAGQNDGEIEHLVFEKRAPCYITYQKFCSDVAAAADTGWNAARAVAQDKPAVRQGSIKKELQNGYFEYFDDRYKELKKQADKLFELMAADSDEMLSDLKRTSEPMQALFELVLAMDREFRQAKDRAGILDYNDLEHFTVQLLTNDDGSPSEIARHVSARFTEIMVDEYQDVNRVQDLIFSSVSKNKTNLFMVGDIKQSIYRFRLAEPELFTEKRDSFKTIQEITEGTDDGLRIPMNTNFRSRREIVDAVNHVFGVCMSSELGGVEYDGTESLTFGAEYYTGNVPMPTVLLADAKSAADSGYRNSTELEAAMIADRIQTLMSGNTIVIDRDKHIARPLEYSDIAVIMRSANKNGDVYRQVFLDRGIPSCTGPGKDFFNSDEVIVLMGLAALIDNPHRDVDLISVLRYPVFGFTADDLAFIREKNKKSDLYTALQKRAEECDKAHKFLALLNSFRDVYPNISVSELVWKILNDTDFLAVCSAMKNGALRRENALEFAALAESFDSTGYRGLHRFVLWLEKRSNGEGLGAGSSEGVRILTIHKSKGLEFPVVFVAALGRKFNNADSSAKLLVDKDLGLGPKIVDNEKKVSYASFMRSAIQLKLKRENLSEELRILYVAMTRAREHLFLTAAINNRDKADEDGTVLSAAKTEVDTEKLLSAGHMIDWVLAACSQQSDAGRLSELLHIEYYDAEAASAAESESEQTNACEPNPKLVTELEERFSYIYPDQASVGLPSKMTATSLKERYKNDLSNEDLESAVMPWMNKDRIKFKEPGICKAREGRTVSATERGTATHALLQYINLNETGSVEQIRSEIRRLEENGYISSGAAEAVSIPSIASFFASDTGKAIIEAGDRLHREFRFSILMPAQQLLPTNSADSILLQGVADCVIVDGDGLTIVDYKTDRLPDKEALNVRADEYLLQMSAYAMALSRVFSKPIKKCVLYFINHAQEVNIPLQNLKMYSIL